MNDRQIKILLIIILLILAAIFIFDRVDFSKKIKTLEAKTVITAKTEQERLREAYTAEIGVREATGNNDGERVEYFQASCGLKKGDMWCAAFVCSSHKDAGIHCPNSGYSPNWFPDNKTIYTHGAKNNLIPSFSDVLGIYFPEKKRIAHVGFIDEWKDGDNYCVTVEGNTNGEGSREGDGVYKKRRLKSQIYKISRWYAN